MARLGLERAIIDNEAYRNSVARFREAKIILPTFSELADPRTIAPEISAALAAVDPDEAHPLNLFRVHWYNGADRKTRADSPQTIVLPESLTGVRAPIIVALGSPFPMISAHKVLAAYGCLAPRIVTGQFDPTVHRAFWPSTGNYCRGGVAISRIMRCRGVAVLPGGMSRERFEWLERWVADDADIIRTPGTESNVKEIYDKCAELDRDPNYIIFNQFCEFGNHLVHYLCTGKALAHAFETEKAKRSELELFAFTSATGSAGTIAAGDYLKETHGTRTVAVEALECPTLLYNGYGEHNIQGIGDKHVPLIHNVMLSDCFAGISDRSTDCLDLLFQTDAGREYLRARRGVPAETVEALSNLGLSGICNVLAAIKTAKYYDLGPRQAIITVATDSARMYGSDRPRLMQRYFGGSFDGVNAAEAYAEHILGCGVDHLLEASFIDRRRILNLGYFTWVEQQGVDVKEFSAREDPRYWRGLRDLLPVWDEMIRAFNQETGASVS